MNHRITVVGTGYVGMSLATLLAKKECVTALDIMKWRVDLVNNHKSPIADQEIEESLKNDELHLHATLDPEEAYKDAEFVIVATPTNYDTRKDYFDTSQVESVILGIVLMQPSLSSRRSRSDIRSPSRNAPGFVK